MSVPARLVSRSSALRTSCLTQNLVTRRPFHSYDHPPPPGSFTPVEKDILAAAFKHVPEHGFSHKAIGLGARDAGYLDISATVIPDGPFGLIRYHLVTQREALAARSQALFPEPNQPGIGARVEALTWERLMANKKVLDRWQEVRQIVPLRLRGVFYSHLRPHRLSPSWLNQATSPPLSKSSPCFPMRSGSLPATRPSTLRGTRSAQPSP